MEEDVRERSRLGIYTTINEPFADKDLAQFIREIIFPNRGRFLLSSIVFTRSASAIAVTQHVIVLCQEWINIVIDFYSIFETSLTGVKFSMVSANSGPYRNVYIFYHKY